MKKHKNLYYFNNGSSENIASGDYIMLNSNSKYGMMYEVTNDEKTDLYVYDGASTKIASSISGAAYDPDNGIIHMYNNCNDHACDYSKYDGSLKPAFEDIAGINNLDNNKYYVFNNYSTTNETYDIHFYNGKSLINVAYDVSVNLIYINY